jgi:purine-nucleoside/S-methyl-5'-thioadenosine phosphorylase / adenosine deaminase
VTLTPPFAWKGRHIAATLLGAHVLFTTRRGGVSEGPYATLNLGLWTADEAAAVLENRDRVAAAAGVERTRFQQGRQVHGSEVRALDEPPEGEPPDSDGQVTGVPGVAPIVLVADCLPIALAGPQRAGMLHAGWRGLAGGIVAHGARAMGEGPLTAAIGPGAGPCCYEVGDEVREAFAELGPGVRRGRNLDLKAVAAARLREAGVNEVHDVGLCTICGDPELFFSHRRDGELTGRQAGLAWRS